MEYLFAVGEGFFFVRLAAAVHCGKYINQNIEHPVSSLYQAPAVLLAPVFSAKTGMGAGKTKRRGLKDNLPKNEDLACIFAGFGYDK